MSQIKSIHPFRMQMLLNGIATFALTLSAGTAFAKTAIADNVVGRTLENTHAPRWPSQPQAPKDAPNVLVVLTDDVGFGVTSTFGGPVPTAAFEQLAKSGLRYNRFNTTALCSPTRASLLTGREPHNVNMGNVANLPTGYDGYTTVIPKSGGTMAEILKQNGYNTAMFGKSHLTPDWEMSAAGPFDRWPTGLGFEYFYGFLSADTSMWEPNITENRRPVSPPTDDPTYHFEADMADKAITWMREQNAIAPDKPFFMYYAPGLAHAPHHAPKEWIEKFKGQFDSGWDAVRLQIFERQKKLGIIPKDSKLSPRPATLPAWDALEPEQKKVYARLMEAFAASVAYSDHQTGRVIEEIRKSGEFDNTLIVYIQGDNGSSAEGGMDGLAFEQSWITRRDETFSELADNIDKIGGPEMYNHMPAAWAWATNAPFPWWKQIASQAGGVRNGMVISWPKVIKDKGELRSQYSHVSDIMPTVLDAIGIEAPQTLNGITQKPIDGLSLKYSFTQETAPSVRRTQIYEMMENFGIYHDGWMAGTLPIRHAWESSGLDVSSDQRQWTLFNLEKDFTTANNLAAERPAKLKELQDLFWSEAAKNNVLPIHNPFQGIEGRPTMGGDRTRFVYPAGVTGIWQDAAPHTIGKSFTIKARFEVSAKGSGVLIAHGGRFGGYSLYLKDGVPRFHYNAVGADQFTVSGSQPLVAGTHELTMRFTADANKPGTAGVATLLVDGQETGSGRLGRTVAGWISHTDGLDIGVDLVSPVTSDYTVETSKFSGIIDEVVVTLEPQ